MKFRFLPFRKIVVASLALLMIVTSLLFGGTLLPHASQAASSTSTVSLYAWGLNNSGQLGNGTTNNNFIPITATLPSGVTPAAISAGGGHSLAIGSNSKLYAWGDNSAGQLGDGTTNNETIPVTITLSGATTPAAISAGGSHSLAIGSNSNLYVWGGNQYGQLGDGTTNNETVPVTITLPSGASPTAISAGSNHSLAIDSNGNLYAWGLNNVGQLGDGTTNDSHTPVTITLSIGVTTTAISAGGSHNLAIGSDGKLYAWGLNNAGQLGDGTTNYSPTPILVSLPSGITPTAISTGGNHSLAIGSDGKLYAWGRNDYGQLGNGTTTEEPYAGIGQLARRSNGHGYLGW